MLKRLSAASVIGVVGLLAIPAAAATFSINEPLSTPGPLSDAWVVSGKDFTPSVITNAGDTPENALRLTEASNGLSGFVLYDTAIPTSNGIDITFHQAQWGGSGADGIVFFVKDASNRIFLPGAAGGSMGYSAGVGDDINGLPGALLGIGLDAYGSFGYEDAGGRGCNSDFTGTNGEGNVNAVTLRGPGNGLDGYCLIANSYKLTDNGKLPLIDDYNSRKDADRKIRVVIDAATKADPKVTVYYNDDQIIEAALPDAFDNVANVNVGFTSGTGGLNNNHEVWGLTSVAADPVEEEKPVDEVEEELADTGYDAITVSAIAAVLLLLGGFTIRASRSMKRKN